MPRPLLDRLCDIEHALRLDKQPLHAVTIREAIEELMRREELMKSVDVNIGNDWGEMRCR